MEPKYRYVPTKNDGNSEPDKKKPPIGIKIILLIGAGISVYLLTSPITIIKNFNDLPLLIQGAIIAFLIVFTLFFEFILVKRHNNIKEYRTEGWIILTILIFFCSWRFYVNYWNHQVYPSNDERIKILVLPFLSDIETNKNILETGLKIEHAIQEEILEDSLSNKVIVKYFDERIHYEIDKRRYDDVKYINEILLDTKADLIIYGSYDNDLDNIVYCWQTSKKLQNYIVKSISNNNLIPSKYKYNLLDLSQGKVSACTRLIISFVQMKIDFITKEYSKTLAKYEILNNHNTCGNCETSKVAYFIATQSALKLWDDKSETFIKTSEYLKGCKLNTEDSISFLYFKSWFYYENSLYILGLGCADSAILIAKRNTLKDTISYLNSVMLKTYGLNIIGKISEAISISKSIVAECKNYPDLYITNLSNIGAYYSKYRKGDQVFIDSSIIYLNLAKEENKKNKDKEIDYIIWRNLLSNYRALLYSDPKPNELDSLKYVKKIGYFESLMNNYESRITVNIDSQDFKSLYYEVGDKIHNSLFALYGSRDTIQMNKVRSDILALNRVLQFRKPNSESSVNVLFDLAFFYKIIKPHYDSSIYYARQMLKTFDRNPKCSNTMQIGAYNVLSHVYLLKYQDNTKIKSYRDSSLKYSNIGLNFGKKISEDNDVYLVTKKLRKNILNIDKIAK